jgi:hypothetical protein
MALVGVNMSDKYPRATASQRESWHLAKYALKQNRETLMAHLNNLVGAPSYTMTIVQDEFISDRMEPGEMVNYARACREIIFSIESITTPGADSIE